MGAGLDWLVEHWGAVSIMASRYASCVAAPLLRTQLIEAALDKCVDDADKIHARFQDDCGASLTTFMKQSMYWTCIKGAQKELKRMRKECSMPDDWDAEVHIALGSKLEALDEVRVYVHGMNAIDREALTLRFVLGWEYWQIAEHCGLANKSSAWQRVHRALDRVRKAASGSSMGST